jgi:hypothetical protein
MKPIYQKSSSQVPIFLNGVCALIILLFVGNTSFGQQQIYTSGTGTFTVPAGVSTIQVRLWGGGGGGGGGIGGTAGGSGGGSGAYTVRTFGVSAGQQFNYAVGALGSGGLAVDNATGNGGSGGETSFVGPNPATTIDLRAGGGGGGVRNGGGAGAGAGGITSGGDAPPSVNGNPGVAGSGSIGGEGGNAPGGGGLGGGRVTAAGPGFPGGTPGGGGGGGRAGGGNNHPGGQGGSGLIEIYFGATITSIAPSSFCSLGGQIATIYGTNLSNASAVTFNGSPAASFTVNSNTQITAITPAGITTGVVTVTTPVGSTTSSAYTVVAPDGSPAPSVSAGPNQTLAACVVSTTLAGSEVPSGGTGTWTVVSGAASITSPNSPTSSVTGLAVNATTTLRWTVTVGCATAFSDVTITTVLGTGCNNAESLLYEVNGTLYDHTVDFTVPSGVTSITVECWGGGGAGSRARTNGSRQAGGGGGAYARSVLSGLTAGTVYDVGVGAGGTSDGLNDQRHPPGGPSFIRLSGVDLVRAAGGQSGFDNANNPGNAGNFTACVFNVVAYSGGNGGNISSTGTNSSGPGGGGAGSSGRGVDGGSVQTHLGGAGGISLGGNGANGVTSQAQDGAAGSRYGAGGSGGWKAGGADPVRPGGQGGVGFVRISFISVLPVELISFTANCEEELVTLKWSTASEYNASHYSVENSRDGINWVEVAEIPAAGTTNQTSHYSCGDNAFMELSYYRLVQVYNDGTRTTYGPVSVQCDIQKSTIAVYPNPTETDFTVMIQTKEVFENVVVELVDLFGRTIDVKEMNIVPGSTLIKFENKNIKPGTYLIRIKGQNDKFTPIQVVVM